MGVNDAMDARARNISLTFTAWSARFLSYKIKSLFFLCLLAQNYSQLYGETHGISPKIILLWDSVEIEQIHLDLIKELRLKYPGIKLAHLLHPAFFQTQTYKIRSSQKIFASLKQTSSPLDDFGWILSDPNSKLNFWNASKETLEDCEGITPCFEENISAIHEKKYYLEQLKTLEQKLKKLGINKATYLFNPTKIWDQNLIESAIELGFKQFLHPYFGKKISKRIQYSKIWNPNLKAYSWKDLPQNNSSCQSIEIDSNTSPQNSLAPSVNCHLGYLLDITYRDDDQDFFSKDPNPTPLTMVRVSSLPLQRKRIDKILKIIENICTKSKQCEKFAAL